MHAVDVALTFVEMAKEEVVEVHRPDAVRQLLEADVLIGQGRRERDLGGLEANAAIGAHVADQVVVGIVGRRNAAGVRSARRAIDRARRFAA